MAAPVCPGSTDIPASQFKSNGVKFPSIPNAYDLQSALKAIAALRETVMLLSQQLQRQAQPAARPASGAGAGGSGAKSQPSKQPNNWKEVNRTTTTERIENPDDPTQFIMQEVITSLTMRNQANGETWTWKR